MAETKLIALGDILGFGDLVMKGPADAVVDNYLEFFGRALRHSIQRNGWPERSATIEELKAETRVGMEWFSDTNEAFAAFPGRFR